MNEPLEVLKKIFNKMNTNEELTEFETIILLFFTISTTQIFFKTYSRLLKEIN